MRCKPTQLTPATSHAPDAHWYALVCLPCGNMIPCGGMTPCGGMYPCGHMLEEPAM